MWLRFGETGKGGDMAAMERKAITSPELLAKAAGLSDLAGYVTGAVVSKTLIDKPVGTITLFAFDTGQGLSEHTAPYDAFVQVLDGHARIRIAEEWLDLKAGDGVIMPANVPHAVQADERFKMLLVMIRA
jgi:quercetin dioxygenase-like cupin family protein